MRDADYLCEVVEHFNSFTKTRKDLFSFGDLIAIRPTEIILIQTTSTANLSARRRKILGECAENAKAWLAAGGKIIVHGWSKKLVKLGGKAMRWTLKETEITAADFAAG